MTELPITMRQTKFENLLGLKSTQESVYLMNSGGKTSPDVVVDSTEDKLNLFPDLARHQNGSFLFNRTLHNNNDSLSYSTYEVTSTTKLQDSQVTSSSSNLISNIENIVREIQSHPLYPLLIRLQQNCELATSKPDSFPTQDTFLVDLKQYIQQKITHDGSATMDFFAESNITLKKNLDEAANKVNRPETPKSKTRKNKRISEDEWSENGRASVNIDENIPSDEEDYLDDHLANAKVTVLTKNFELDEVLIRAIQVLRIHMIELQKVNELCKDFCIRYMQSLKAKFQSETSLLDSQPSTPSESEAMSPGQFGFNSQGNFNGLNDSYGENGQFWPSNDGSSGTKRRSSNPNLDSRSSTRSSDSSSSNQNSTLLNHFNISAHTAAALNASLDQIDSYNFSSNSSSGSRQKRGVLPKKATQIMKQWLFQHLVHPYPTEDEKRNIATQTNLTLLQVNNWFINARRRILQPMLDSSSHITLMDGLSDDKGSEHPTIVNKKKKAATNRPSNNRFWPASLAAAAAIHPVAAGLIPGNSLKSDSKLKSALEDSKMNAQSDEEKRTNRKRQRKTETPTPPQSNFPIIAEGETDPSDAKIAAASTLLTYISRSGNSNSFYSPSTKSECSKQSYDEFWSQGSYPKNNFPKNDQPILHGSSSYGSFGNQSNSSQSTAANLPAQIFDTYESIYKKTRDSDYFSNTYNQYINLYNNGIQSESMNSYNNNRGSHHSTENTSTTTTTVQNSTIDNDAANKNQFISLWSDSQGNPSEAQPNFSTSASVDTGTSTHQMNSNSISNYFFQNDYLNPLWSQFSMGMNPSTNSRSDVQPNGNFDPMQSFSSNLYSTDQIIGSSAPPASTTPTIPLNGCYEGDFQMSNASYPKGRLLTGSAGDNEKVDRHMRKHSESTSIA